MTTSQPPRVATWLLKRLVSGETRESLIGDLVEQHRLGRSWRWYWRQTILAIADNIANDIGDNKGTAVRAAILGVVVYQLAAFPVNFLSDLLTEIPPRLFVYGACAMTGAIVARLHPTCQTAMVSVASLSVLLFESVHVVLRLALDGGRHQLTPQMLLIVNTLMLGGPVCILVGGLSVPPRRSSPDRRAA